MCARRRPFERVPKHFLFLTEIGREREREREIEREKVHNWRE